MNEINEIELYERAIKTWGKGPQMMQVIEEMAELTKELMKNVNRNKRNGVFKSREPL